MYTSLFFLLDWDQLFGSFNLRAYSLIKQMNRYSLTDIFIVRWIYVVHKSGLVFNKIICTTLTMIDTEKIRLNWNSALELLVKYTFDFLVQYIYKINNCIIHEYLTNESLLDYTKKLFEYKRKTNNTHFYFEEIFILQVYRFKF